MMRQMRENTKWIMLITALAFVALMVFEWGMDITGQSSLGMGEIGEVDGVSVMYEEYEATRRRIYDQVQQNQSEPVTSQQSSQIEDRAWDEVVNQILIRQELNRRGIRVSDEELRQAARYSPPPWFRDEPTFQDEDGNFSLERYQQFLASQQGNQQFLLELESYYRDVIPRSKLLRQVSSGIYVSDGKLWRAYRDAHESVRVRYVSMDPAQRVADSLVTVSDDEIETYYEEHREDFEVPAQATVKVVSLSKAATPADTVAALELAREIRQEILDGADFAELAQTESADSASAAQGGDLGTFARGEMVLPAFEEAAFDAPPGQVTEPVQTQFGFHLIRVDERWTDSIRASHILIPIERTDDSELELLIMADSLEDMGENMPLEQAAAELGREVRTQQITEAFPVAPGVGQAGEGMDWALEEASPGDVSPVFENDQAFYAFELVSSEPSGYLPLEEATPTIRRILSLRKKIERARRTADEIVRAARQAGDLGVAGSRSLEVREAGPFTRNEFVEGLGRQNAAIGAAFGLEEGAISDPVEAEENLFIVQLVSRTPADSAAWLAQKEEQRAQTIQTLQEQRLQQWLEGLRRRAAIFDRRDEAFRQAEQQQEGPQMPGLF